MAQLPPAPTPIPSPPIDWTPKPKVIAGAVAGAVVTIAVWVLHAALHVDEPPEVAAAEVLLVGVVIAYLVPGAG